MASESDQARILTIARAVYESQRDGASWDQAAPDTKSDYLEDAKVAHDAILAAGYPKSLPELTPEQIRKAAAADAPPYRPREIGGGA